MTMDTRTVLVTGALGWLGRSLVEALVKGLPDIPALSEPQPDLRVRCLIMQGQSATSLQKLSDRVEVVEGDLRSDRDCARFCQGVDGAILFHTAGIIHPRRVSEFHEVNVGGTRNLLDAAKAAGIRRIVVVSSNSPCGCNPHRDHLFDEESPFNPYMGYGRSKMAMERAVWESTSGTQLEAVIIRPPWFYGPNQPERQTLFFRMIRDGKAPIVGRGDNLRSMAYIDNLSQGLLLSAMHPSAAGETFWIADERPYSMNEIVDTVEHLLEGEFGQTCTHKRLRLPGVVSDVAQVCDAALQKCGVYHQKIHVLSEMNKTIACSVAKAQRVLGYAPGISLEEGMRRSLQWTLETYGRI